jgi:hypothetical protein
MLSGNVKLKLLRQSCRENGRRQHREFGRHWQAGRVQRIPASPPRVESHFFACMQILDPHSFRCGALVPSSSITGSIAQETLGDGGRCNTWPTTPSPLSNCSSETRSFFLRSKTTLPWPYHDVTWMPPLNLCVCRPGPPTIATCETDLDRLTRRGGRLAPTQPGSTSDSRRR